MNLEMFSETPRHRPDCCLGISTTLIARITAVLPCFPKYSLSIGCGSGLLEALLNCSAVNTVVYGVEVNLSVSHYLTESFRYAVPGTYALCPAAADAAVWLFVYPRDVQLVKRYIQEFGENKVEKILWLGPRVDWADYSPVFEAFPSWLVEEVTDAGLVPYEMMTVITRERSVTLRAAPNE